MLHGILIAFDWQNVLYVILAMPVAIILGALPGIGPGLAMALVVPFTFYMNPITAMILLGAIKLGCIHGGGISSILINVPGTAGSAVTCLDGHKMSQNGKSGDALGLSVTASAVGGIAGVIALLLFAPFIAKFTLAFGPSEFFWLGMWGISIVAAFTGGSFLRGTISAGIGCFISFIGYDIFTGAQRYTFGQLSLMKGIDIVPIVIGLFAITEMMALSSKEGMISQSGKISGSVIRGLIRPFHYPMNLLRSSFIGAVVGALPGIGMTAASFLAYNEAKRSSKDKTPFGEGNEEGVIAPETANIATTGGALIPALTLGIPGSESTAIFLSALFIQGIKPGFDLFQKHPDMLWALGSGMIMACFIMVLFGTVGIPLFSKVTLVPTTILIPLLIPLIFMGAYATSASLNDIFIALLVGVVGYFMKKFGYSVVAMLIAFMLAPMIEQNYHRAIDIAGNDYFQAFFRGWLNWILVIITVLSFIFIIRRELKDRKAFKEKDEAEQAREIEFRKSM